MKTRIYVIVVLMAAAYAHAEFWQPVVTDPNSVKKTLKILFIGNSHVYYNDLDKVLKKLSVSPRSPVKIFTSRVVEGGATLEDHWDNTKASAFIKAKPWDMIILQEQSARPLKDPQAFIKYAEQFNARIREKKSQTMLFMMWAYRDYPKMIEGFQKIFTDQGKKMESFVAPVGLAFQISLKNHPEITLHDEDGFHPSPNGTYLAACVFYASLTGRSPVGLPNGGMKHLNKQQAQFLQEAAWSAVQGYADRCSRQQEENEK